jgi:hypothetical protein
MKKLIILALLTTLASCKEMEIKTYKIYYHTPDGYRARDWFSENNVDAMLLQPGDSIMWDKNKVIVDSIVCENCNQ